MKRLLFRRGVVLTLALALVALVAVLWATGLSSQPRQALANAPANCAASLTSPSNNAIITDTSPLLDWSNGTCTLANLTPHTSDDLKWHVQVDDTSSSFGSVVREKGNISYTTTQWTVSSDLPLGDYWWRVRVCHSTDDPDPADVDCSTWSSVRKFTVDSGPDLTVSKGDTADPVSYAESFGYDIVVHNGGNEDVTDAVKVTDHLPPGFAYVSYIGSAWTCIASTSGSDSFQTGSHRDVTCTTNTDIAADANGPPLHLYVTAASAADTYTNWVEVDPDDNITEINEDNNTDGEETTVTAGVDLTVSKTDTADPVSLGGSFGYDIVVSNGGSGTVTATVEVEDHLPPGFAYVSYTGSAWTCTSSTSSSDTFQTGSHTDVTCSTTTDIAAAAAGPSLRLNVTAASTADTYTNKVEVDPDDNITETNETNNTDSEGTTVGAAVDLTVSKTDTDDPVSLGGSFSYDIVVGNNGSGTVTATVEVEDHLPPGFAYVSYTGSAWTCTSSTSSSDTSQTGSHTDVLCSNGTDIAAGADGPSLRLNVTAASTAATYTNRVEVDPDDTITETNENNNTDSEQTTVTGGALLNCPLSGKWAISVWDGPSGTPIAQALATCTGVTIDGAYSLDRTTNQWLKYFPGHTDISDLLTLSNMQAILTIGH